MNEAIKLAIEKGGYNLLGFADKPNFVWSIDKYHLGELVSVEFGKRDDWGDKKLQNIYHDFDVRCVLVDPLFWQALGKALKFDQPIWDCHKKYPNAHCDNREYCPYGGWKDVRQLAIDYFTLVYDGGDTEKFFKDLLSNH